MQRINWRGNFNLRNSYKIGNFMRQSKYFSDVSQMVQAESPAMEVFF